MERSSRPYDVVVLGATGFAGKLTAEYLARNAPPGLRWTIAGRNRDKLATVLQGLAGIDESAADAEPIVADTGDPASLRDLAAQTRVLATTVGPYVLYGDGVVGACAAAGTDYLDLTGEPEFVDRTYIRHHRTAAGTGARLVHAAGFDSIPHDLGVLFTVLQLPADVPVRVRGFVRASGMASGGTFASAMTAFSRGRQNVAAARERRAAEGSASTSRIVHSGAGRPGRDPVDGGWTLPFPSLDPQVVGRSARALERYGPDFSYQHHVSVARLPIALGIPVGVGALFAAAQVPPARRALMNRLAAGTGPSLERRQRSWFTVTFVGEAGDQQVATRVSGGDPGYDETARMLAESALCLALDDLPATAGQVTTAQAMGEPLIDRLRKSGMGFEIIG